MGFEFGFACGVASAFAVSTIGLVVILCLAIRRAAKDGDSK